MPPIRAPVAPKKSNSNLPSSPLSIPARSAASPKNISCIKSVERIRSDSRRPCACPSSSRIKIGGGNMPAHPPASSNTGSLNIATVEILPRSSNIAT